MSVINKVRQLLALEDALTAPTQKERFEAQLLRQQRQEQDQRLRFMINKQTDLYFKASNNPALQKNLLGSMKGFMNSLPKEYQEVFKPYLQTGPFSKTEALKQQFISFKPPPESPPQETLTTDPYARAQYEFSRQDWNAELQHFITKQKPMAPRNMIALGEGLVALRDKDGIINLTSEENVILKAKAKEYGGDTATLGQLLANNGRLYSKDKRMAQVEGEQVEVKSYYNILDGQVGVEPIYHRGGQTKPFSNPLLHDLMISYASDPESLGNSKGARLATQIRTMREAGKSSSNIIENVLRPQFPGLNFAFVKPTVEGDNFEDAPEKYPDGWWSSLWGPDAEGELLRAFPGTLTQFATRPDGSPYTAYYDKKSQMVYSRSGRPIGTPQEVIELSIRKGYKPAGAR